jgi:FAD/FMN-containing dehydrogenase
MDEGPERVRQAYGEAKYRRLVALKDRLDPHNVFRMNQNIAPSTP